MSEYLPGYDNWKTTDPSDRPEPRPEPDPDMAREEKIERERLRKEWERGLKDGKEER